MRPVLAQASLFQNVFLWLGADAEETILNAFKVFDPEGKGYLKKDL